MLCNSAFGHTRQILAAGVGKENDHSVVVAAKANIRHCYVVADDDVEVLAFQFLGSIAQEFFRLGCKADDELVITFYTPEQIENVRIFCQLQ